MSAYRPMIVAMNNPISSDPRHALFPYPPGCTGHRVLEYLRRRRPEVTRAQYLAAFDRRNLVSGKRWDRAAAVRGAEALVAEVQHTGRTILVLGEETRRAIGLAKITLAPMRYRGCTWRLLPHPSGRCFWYNEEGRRDIIAGVLEQMYEEYEDTCLRTTTDPPTTRSEQSAETL